MNRQLVRIFLMLMSTQSWRHLYSLMIFSQKKTKGEKTIKSSPLIAAFMPI